MVLFGRPTGSLGHIQGYLSNLSHGIKQPYRQYILPVSYFFKAGHFLTKLSLRKEINKFACISEEKKEKKRRKGWKKAEREGGGGGRKKVFICL